jgi:hypothetical protein
MVKPLVGKRDGHSPLCTLTPGGNGADESAT